MNHRSLLAGVVLGTIALLALMFGGPGFAQVRTDLIRGGGHAGVLSEGKFKFRTVKSNHGVVNTSRNVLVVPKSYGKPFAVTAAGQKSVIWYRSDDDTLRNVVVNNADAMVEISLQE